MRESTLSPAFVTVPKGAVVETSCEFHESGLVQIKLEGEPLFAFMRDLREQAVLVDEPMLVRAASVGN